MNHHAIQSSNRYLFTVVLGSISEYGAEGNCAGKFRAFTVSTARNRGDAHREGEDNSDFIGLHSRYFTVAKTCFPPLNCCKQALSLIDRGPSSMMPTRCKNMLS